MGEKIGSVVSFVWHCIELTVKILKLIIKDGTSVEQFEAKYTLFMH